MKRRYKFLLTACYNDRLLDIYQKDMGKLFVTKYYITANEQVL